MWSMILLMSCLLGGHSMSVGRRLEKLGYQQAGGRHVAHQLASNQTLQELRQQRQVRYRSSDTSGVRSWFS